MNQVITERSLGARYAIALILGFTKAVLQAFQRALHVVDIFFEA